MAMATRTLALYFTTSNEKVDGKRRRILDKNKAGLILRPSVLVAVVRRMVRRDQDDLYHISKGFTLYLTAVIQYIMSKILESAGDVAHSEQRVRITSAHLDQVLLNELNLFHLFTTRVNPTFDSEVDRLLRLKYKESAPI
jgi:histone H3/H4